MKITLSWLRQHLEFEGGVTEVVDTLNRIGLEVEGVEDPAARLTGFRIARVLTAERHPQADKLQVLSVDTGDGAPLQVVCGAPNARAGLIGVLGLPGAVVPANGMELKVSAIRGVESNGMMCSSRELEQGDDHDGIIELNFDNPGDAPIGMAFADYSGSDPIIDISVTPNRQDCMGVRGIARDLAAAGLGVLKPLKVPMVEGIGSIAIPIRIDDPEGCPAFWGRTISGLTNGTAPEWMRRRLNAVGQRSISALVDITNYVMLDLGRPSHAYDLATLTGSVTARRAHEGEMASALNGKDYVLSASMTVIADDAGVHDIAGIMGGAHSGCSETTTDVLLEVAYFTPEHIALTGQALALTSDARARFERGVDPAFLDEATAILTAYILDICGGSASEVMRVGAPPITMPTISYDPALALARGGVELARERQAAILESLGFTIGTDWTVTVPSWRRDVHGPADIVEEVARIAGFDAIASTPLPRSDGVAKPTATALQLTERKLRRAAATAGFHEAVTWSFIPEACADAVGGSAWSIANPISEEMKVMRPSLLPGLLMAAARNQNRGCASVRLFELGRRYLADAERPTLALLMAGERSPRGWQAGKSQGFDAFDAKRAVIALLDAAGAPTDKLQVMSVDRADGIWHPGQSATLRLGPKTVLAEFGTLHPALAKTFDVDGMVVAAQLFIDAIPAKRGAGSPVRDAFTPPALQAVIRDFAFLVPDSLTAGDLVRVIKGADKAAIVDVRLFDRFTGAGVPDGQVSLAVEVTLQPGDKSFTEPEIKTISDKIIAAAAKFGAGLRG